MNDAQKEISDLSNRVKDLAVRDDSVRGSVIELKDQNSRLRDQIVLDDRMLEEKIVSLEEKINLLITGNTNLVEENKRVRLKASAAGSDVI